ELLRRVFAQPGRDLRQDLRCCVDDDPVLWRFAHLGRVVTERVASQVGELGERLHARVAGADENEGELSASVLLGWSGGCGFEPEQNMVAEGDRVCQILEAEGMLREPRDWESPRDCA